MFEAAVLFFKSGIGKLWPYLAFFVGGMAVWGGLKASGRKEGRQEVINKVNNESRKIQDKWSEIDARTPDYDDAIDRLRRNQRNND